MAVRLADRVHVSPVRPGLWAACGLLIVVLAGANLAGYARFLTFRSRLEPALSPTPSGEIVPVAWSFPFQESRCMVSVELDAAEIEAAGRVRTGGIFGSSGWLRRCYVREVVHAQAGSPVIDRLADGFRRIRRDRDLDSDEYLELLCAGIQAIPYGEVGGETVLAAEMLADGAGICTDKSILLASLLVHEGYDTVLWVFSTQRHVALGVASDAACFQGTGYAFIETTGPSYVGQAASEYRAVGPIARAPALITLGGSRSYGAGEQVEVILGELRRLQVAASAAEGYAALAMTPVQYRDRYAARATERWIADTTATYILTNAHDRPGVYAILTGFAPAADAPLRLRDPSDA